jgi:hypothetical protein
VGPGNSNADIAIGEGGVERCVRLGRGRRHHHLFHLLDFNTVPTFDQENRIKSIRSTRKYLEGERIQDIRNIFFLIPSI